MKKLFLKFGCVFLAVFCPTFWTFVLCFPFSVRAEVVLSQKEGNPETKDMEEVPPITTIVSASRREIPVEKATRFVTVITREEIEKSGKVYVIDLLRGQPGLSVNQSGPSGRTASVFMRGSNSNHVLVMMDGVQLNSPTTGQADLADLTVESIERIEVLRGPQSVLYGSQALAGVINIVTKAGGKPGLHGEARAEFGTNRTFYETAGLSGDWKKFAFSGSGSRLDSRGPSQNNGFENTRGFGHGKIEVTENSDLDVAFHYDHAIVGIEDGPFLQDPNASDRTVEQDLNTQYNLSLTDWWQQSVKYAFFHEHEVSFDPPDPGTSQTESPYNLFQLGVQRHTLDYQSDFRIGDFDVVTMGYQFDYATGLSKQDGGFSKIVRNHGWFAQNELTLWEIWTVAAGVRIDKNDLCSAEASPLVSTGLWIAKTMTKLKGSFGKGFRAPSFNEMFYPGFGNTSVQPEKNWAWDAGFEQFYWGKKGSFSASYFHNSITNLIQAVEVSSYVYEAQNVARATTQGVELENRITPFKDFTIYANYTYTDAMDKSTGKRLIRRPWHQGKVGFSYDWRVLHFSTDCVFVGTREDSAGWTRPPREKNQGFARWDAALFCDVTRYFQIYGRVENLLNKHYDEVMGYNSPLARFFVGLKAKF